MWIQRLSEESQARILGYWELSKRKNVDVGPLSAATLTELLKVVACDKNLLNELNFTSKTQFEKAIGCLPNIRNQIMHPVRPLIINQQTCLDLEKSLRMAIIITDKIYKMLQDNEV